jgi:hypothetical protein
MSAFSIGSLMGGLGQAPHLPFGWSGVGWAQRSLSPS